MNSEKNYIEINRESWNRRTEAHLKSAFYDLEGFISGTSSLNGIELNLLGDIKGKRVLHLQCHFGQDTISLSRLGAEVTGVDFSDKAIESARQIADRTGSNVRFICCDIYNLPKYLDEKFDIVFTSYGTIGWLPDMDKWAKIVSNYLKANGTFVFVEFHPVVWMFDDNFEKITYNYFKSDAIVETQNGTYADKNAEITVTDVSWNHGLSEVMNSLIQNSLEILHFEEFDYSPYNCLNNMVEIAPNKFQIQDFGNKIPMVYALKAKLKDSGI